jgi:hypothetical protein
MYALTDPLFFKCMKLTNYSYVVSAANLLLIKTTNSDQEGLSVLSLELLNQWSAFPMKNTSANLTLFSIGVSVGAKHFSACLSQPMGFSQTNLENSSLIPLLRDCAKVWS